MRPHEAFPVDDSGLPEAPAPPVQRGIALEVKGKGVRAFCLSA